jgi:hypothetical protein
LRLLKSGFELSLASSVSGIVRVNVPGFQAPGTPVFVDRRLFLPFILAGKSWRGDFKTVIADKTWYIRQGSRRAEFSLRIDPVGGYGTWVDYSGLKEIKLSDELRKILMASFNCATVDPSMPQLNCVYLGGKLVMATNHTVLFVGASQKENGLQFPFPVGVIPLLGDGLITAVGIDGDKVILDCGCGYLEGTVNAVAQKSFPKKQVVQEIINGRKWPTVVKLPAERLARMMRRLVEYLAGIRREDWTLLLELGDGKLKATVKVQQGKFEEVMEVEEAKNDASLRWPLEMVLPVLEYMGQNGNEVRIKVDEAGKSPYLISGAGVELMVARLKS